MFGHRRHIYIPICQLPGKPRQCDHARWSVGHPDRTRRHRCYLPSPLPSRADASPILALRWLRPRVRQSVILSLPPRQIVRLVQTQRYIPQQHIQVGLNGRRARWRAQI